jgi:steroid delta-isomerase
MIVAASESSSTYDRLCVSNAENISRTVRTYLELAGKGSADGLVALYAEDATVEDPVGSDVHHGLEAIRSFYHSAIPNGKFAVDLLSLNVVGGEAAFHFQLTIDADRLDVIEVMTFDDDAKITSMRAYFGPSNWSQI